ncbi:putative diphthamide synthesis protein-domain-containing protein [Podospora appendiculata]|uniref:2-(3-amino-3-carboxypropyl)histidine synthase subunit 2 n=1 Tax=Podospora appendiculata TaxID=314037 RepID=A0AAE0XBA2_9PEZI|nr:putative diphthamide synthesis protein-domain-containing protein [Podospora appendiculata]
MASELSAAPALSTPAEHLFEHVDPVALAAKRSEAHSKRRSDDELRAIYEIARTAREIKNGGWKRIALQFPDSMLGDAPWAVQALSAELASLPAASTEAASTTAAKPERIYILADTSYSSCCVDEIAAEHADADVVVHYGRSCLSPTSRLAVIYVFTQHTLDHAAALDTFTDEFPARDSSVVLMADVTYQDHVATLLAELQTRGYTNLLATSIIHDPTGRIPNRAIATDDPSAVNLQDYSVFHISTPPTALLLALSSRVKSLFILPTVPATSSSTPAAHRMLGRRYARVLSLATAGIIGILVNTLSVANYLASIDSIRQQIAAAGKKSYTVVVGKLNPAKLANFAEIDGWVIVGCWESSLVEDDSMFYKPVITPFELDVALHSDETRVWTGEWWGGIEGVKPFVEKEKAEGEEKNGEGEGENGIEGDISGEESEPPQFDLRTGKLVSHSRPMRRIPKTAAEGDAPAAVGEVAAAPNSSTLALRPKAELATVNGVVSPGAEYLRSQRTWQGLGSDFVEEDATAIEEGRSGVARGYTVGASERT